MAFFVQIFVSGLKLGKSFRRENREELFVKIILLLQSTTGWKIDIKTFGLSQFLSPAGHVWAVRFSEKNAKVRITWRNQNGNFRVIFINFSEIFSLNGFLGILEISLEIFWFGVAGPICERSTNQSAAFRAAFWPPSTSPKALSVHTHNKQKFYTL